MKIVLSNKTTILNAPEFLLRDVMARLTIENPAYIDAVRMGRWTGKIDKFLVFYRSEDSGGISVPRGFTGQPINMAKQGRISCQIEDRRKILTEVGFSFAGEPKPYQQGAIRDILSRDSCALQAPPGSGKTVMAMAVIAERRQPTLVIVHSRELLNQWLNRIATFLGVPRAEIGTIGGGKARIGEKITVGIINSIYPIAGDIKQHFGLIIVDECHRTPSRTFTGAVTAFDAKYMLGLSATPYRRDGLTKLIGWYLGPQVTVDESALTDKDVVRNVEIVTRQTSFTSCLDASEQYSQMLSALTEDIDRNRLIVNDVLRETSNGGGVCLVLSDRKAHCETITSMLRGAGIAVDMLTGSTASKERQAIVDRLDRGDVRVLIATGQLIGEGFDATSLQTLFLSTPIKFSGRLIQYLGRVLRAAPGKDRAKVYDYTDPIGVLMASARSRQNVYKQWQ